MAQKLPDDNVLRTINDDYNLSVIPGKRYLFALTGQFGGATVTLKRWDHGLHSYIPIKDGAFTAGMEDRLTLPNDKLRLTLSGATGDTLISVTCTPIQ